MATSGSKIPRSISSSLVARTEIFRSRPEKFRIQISFSNYEIMYTGDDTWTMRFMSTRKTRVEQGWEGTKNRAKQIFFLYVILERLKSEILSKFFLICVVQNYTV